MCPPLLPVLLAPVCSQNKEGHISVGTSVLIKLSQQRQDCIDIKAGLLAWFYGWAFTHCLFFHRNNQCLQGFLPAPPPSILPLLCAQSWYMFHICRVPLLTHCNLVSFRMLQGTRGIAWLCRYNRKFKEDQCLHRDWYPKSHKMAPDMLRHLHATLISSDRNGCLSTLYTCRYLLTDT